jgi:flagellar biosynthetic protein FliO
VRTATPEPPGATPGPSAGEGPRARQDLAAIGAVLRGISWREPATAWRQLVELFGLPKLVVAGALIVLVLGALLLPGGERGDPFDGPGAAMDLVLKLGAVLALAYVSLAALKRYTSGSVSQRGSLLEVLDSTTLGPNRSVYVVRAGEKRLVLGVTQNQITALAELDPDEPSAPEAVG